VNKGKDQSEGSQKLGYMYMAERQSTLLQTSN